MLAKPKLTLAWSSSLELGLGMIVRETRGQRGGLGFGSGVGANFVRTLNDGGLGRGSSSGPHFLGAF